MSTELQYTKDNAKSMRFLDFPNEIIIEIFLLCMPWEWQTTGYTFPSARTAPILLTHISSSWRSFVHSTPILWSGLIVSDAATAGLNECIYWKTVPKRMDHIAAQLDLWTGLRIRSGNPLDLRCHFHAPYSPTNAPTPWNPIMTHIIDESLCHIRKFGFYFDGHPYFHLLARNSYFLPVLETLDLQFEDLESELETFKGIALPITTFNNAPNLRKVILNFGDIIYPPAPVAFQLPWKQLTHLIICHFCVASDFVFLTKECHALELLFFTLYRADGEPMPTAEAVVMPSLRQLEVIFNSEAPFTLDVFSFLSLPVLEECELYCDPDQIYSFTWHTPSSGLDHMCQQLRNLRCLRFGYMDISANMLIDVLQRTPLLVELAVDSQLVSYVSFIRALTFHNGDDPSAILVPKLEHLRLYIELHWRAHWQVRTPTDDPDFPFRNDDLLSMLASRSVKQPLGGQHPWQPVPLKTMYVGVEMMDDSDFHGLDVDVLAGQVANLHFDTKFALDLRPSARWMMKPVETW